MAAAAAASAAAADEQALQTQLQGCHRLKGRVLLAHAAMAAAGPDLCLVLLFAAAVDAAAAWQGVGWQTSSL
jgi:hypothetical protein